MRVYFWQMLLATILGLAFWEELLRDRHPQYVQTIMDSPDDAPSLIFIPDAPVTAILDMFEADMSTVWDQQNNTLTHTQIMNLYNIDNVESLIQTNGQWDKVAKRWYTLYLYETIKGMFSWVNRYDKILFIIHGGFVRRQRLIDSLLLSPHQGGSHLAGTTWMYE
ncbi:hypothetical protein BHE90_013094 [Fusarium euwallaceae]|uniref:Uncharacterized protein n=3 Tax=Fusarium solani species complex TaxID=232080 RepID=A0A3M2RF24_9HYPO|nr:hypothetical protein CDV36_014923 [Fusarium kuroshium]RSL61682.1 hypothetical protein CEP51_013601 [Fusarium floridanum]RTE72497.1 hypothetical protein BHE90_013094 [Fusarium euwallaceae]